MVRAARRVPDDHHVPGHRAPRRRDASGFSDHDRRGCGASSTASTRPAWPRATPPSTRPSIREGCPTASPGWTSSVSRSSERRPPSMPSTSSRRCSSVMARAARATRAPTGRTGRRSWSPTRGRHSSSTRVDRTTRSSVSTALERRRTVRRFASFDRVHRHPRQPVDKLVDPRLSASNDILTREPVSVDTLAAHLRSHVGGDEGYTVCMHVPEVEETRASIIAELVADGPPRVWTTQGSPCEHEYTRSW